MIQTPPEQGQLVSVRQRQWVLSKVVKSALPLTPWQTLNGHSQFLTTPASIEDDGLGEELQMIWELEPGAAVIEHIALSEPTGFDTLARLAAFLDAVRWGATSIADVCSIQSPFRSRIASESCTALLELLDNQWFVHGTPPDKNQLSAVTVRRLKSELPSDDFGQSRFPRRTLEALEVEYPEEEKHVHALLRQYARLRQARAPNTATRFATDSVLMPLKKKRLFSSLAAFAITLPHYERTLRNATRRVVRGTLAFFTKLANHIETIKYFICHDNLAKVGRQAAS